MVSKKCGTRSFPRVSELEVVVILHVVIAGGFPSPNTCHTLLALAADEDSVTWCDP